MENSINNMKHFLMIVNSFKDEGLRLTKEIMAYIERAEAVPVLQAMARSGRMQPQIPRIFRRRRSASLCLVETER